ncbi:hypothetical protein NB640_05000 [Oxalobacter vibrioformis]|uniref:Uncharacterized protein n=1 Tax=Oxalobacter vibrioformis TaxID=933080 RepID=A0A9E9P473_9BURK|nr:hypothetical protein [Oxalobacter vibrioformis]WAW10995.1 hypothetical protein NB640_05000 [Oxalobacter vibrioformis]
MSERKPKFDMPVVLSVAAVEHKRLRNKEEYRDTSLSFFVDWAAEKNTVAEKTAKKIVDALTMLDQQVQKEVEEGLMHPEEVAYSLRERKAKFFYELEEINGLTLLSVLTKVTPLLAREARALALELGIGRHQKDYEKAKRYAFQRAAEIWGADKSKRIGFVVDEIENIFRMDDATWPAHVADLKKETIKGWLRKADKDGMLIIPEAARRGGRPKRR